MCVRDSHWGWKLKHEEKSETAFYYCAAVTDAIIRQDKTAPMQITKFDALPVDI